MAEPDPVYVLARATLLDALEGLQDQLDAIVLVGAQAIYMHTGDAHLAIAPYTTDADLALDPEALLDDPKLAEAMKRAGFEPHATDLGIWIGGTAGATVDLLVPETLGGPGRRGARLGLHGNRTARKVRGLEAVMIDRSLMLIEALDPTDNRRFEVSVAGPAALLIAKLHKLSDRQDQGRQNDKDAFDVYRLLTFMEAGAAAIRLDSLRSDEQTMEGVDQALGYLNQLFGTEEAAGSKMAARNVEGVGDPLFVRAACAALAQELLAEMAHA